MITARALILVGFCLWASGAEAQQATLGQMERQATNQCMAGQLGPNTSPGFCSCWVQTWVQLWNDNDYNIWTQTTNATQHMRDMESVAARQCSGR